MHRAGGQITARSFHSFDGVGWICPLYSRISGGKQKAVSFHAKNDADLFNQSMRRTCAVVPVTLYRSFSESANLSCRSRFSLSSPYSEAKH